MSDESQSELVTAYMSGQRDARDLIKVQRKTITALQAENERLRGALDDLQAAEKAYRHWHDVEGDGSRHAGWAWDQMRKAGDKARALKENKT